MGKYFGTDGFRGEANVNLMPEHAYRVGRFLGWYFRKEGQECRIIIGKDTRRSGYMLEYALSRRRDRLWRQRLPAPRDHHAQRVLYRPGRSGSTAAS